MMKIWENLEKMLMGKEKRMKFSEELEKLKTKLMKQ